MNFNGWHKSYGFIKYDPPRPDMKRGTRWWAVIIIDREITRYYRWWVEKEVLNPLDIKYISNSSKKYDICELQKPAFDAHISIIRGEEPHNNLKYLWKKYDGKKVWFWYRHYPRQTGDTTNFDRPNHFWFVEVYCPFLDKIRNELCLKTGWKYHITVGKTYD